ncbi:MAG TPA: hypothetical protein VG456_10395 [Candidatus Sulfopaludibacter sp.]|jgi:hypothetical protein|nr:hypothetical protein [Candidatus Sulfopaludibacter sp.]
MSIRTMMAGLLALAMGVYAQNPPPGGRGRGARFLGAEAGPSGRVVKNAPYSADMITESTQALADGNHIRQSTESRVFRDSEGRTRTEQSLSGLGALAGNTSLPRVVFINDPVAGNNYALNSTNKTATRTFGGMRAPRPGGPPKQDHRPDRMSSGANVKTEALGKQTIEGVVAEGTRTTVTIPAGSVGNEQPIQVVSERWYSPELQTIVLSKHSDPRSGDTTTRLANISRAEPARTLFEVPADYKIN